MKYKFGICGPFDFSEQGTGGQSVKTREFYYALCESIGEDHIRILESTNYKRDPLKFFLDYISLLHNCENIVLFPAQNGIRIFAPFSAWFKKGKVHYAVIGGWLPQLLQKEPYIKKYLNNFDTILVETNVLKRALESQGLLNVKRLVNFKRLVPIPEKDLRIHNPLRLCYFSRVTKEKGIEDAIDVVSTMIDRGYSCLFDIYGPVTPEYEKEFEKLRKNLPNGIRYCGKVAPEKSIETLKEYDIQLFPTHYPTEGIPGSILDSYFAGVPVLAAKWNSFDDVIIEGKTGIGYEQGDNHDFYVKLNWLTENITEIETMKRNCLKEAIKYTPQVVIQRFFNIIN